MVMLNASNIYRNCTNELLIYKNLRFFKILRVINNSTYKFKLFQSINSIFSIFYTCFFYFNKSYTLLGHIIPLFLSIQFDKKVGLKKYIIKRILNSKIDKRKTNLANDEKSYLIYKIKFIGRNEYNTNLSWQILINIAKCFSFL